MDICQSARVGDVAAVKKELAAGVSPNKVDRLGFTPLHWAVQEGHLEVAKVLLESGANPNCLDAESQSPLHWAVDKENAPITKLLLEHNADVNLMDKFLHSSLHRAAAVGKPEVVSLLTEAGADVDLRNQNGWTALHVASYYDNLGVVSILVEGNDVNPASKDGWTPLHCCAMQGYADIALKLLTHGADVNAQSKDGNTPLHIAAGEGKVAIVELLRISGANLTILNQKNEPPTGATPEITSLLHTPFVHPKLDCKASGDGLKYTHAGNSASFQLEGKSLKDPNSVFVVFRQKDSSRYFAFTSRVKAEGEVFRVTYTPPRSVAGLFEVWIKIEATPIPGSPFSLEIIPHVTTLNSREVMMGSSSMPTFKQKAVELQAELQRCHQDIASLQRTNAELTKQLKEMELKHSSPSATPSVSLECEKCHTSERDTLLLPCLHFKFCQLCAKVPLCPHCQVPVCGFLKVKL